MKAVTYQGPNRVAVTNVDDPKLERKDDIIVKITSTAICGSDLHLYQGNMLLPEGYIIGHEPMGIVEETGPDVTKVKKGDRVVIHSMYLAASAFIASWIRPANVIIPTRIMIQGDTSDTQRNSGIILAGRRNI